MNVQLISYSQPTAETCEWGLTDVQELVAFCARVSNPTNQLNSDTSEKLIRYLIKHQHWSPLEMVSACIEITTTLPVKSLDTEVSAFRSSVNAMPTQLRILTLF
jgi:thymidylate synthase (FAD)